MKKLHLSLIVLLLSVLCHASDRPLSGTLHDLQADLYSSIVQMPLTQAYYEDVYTRRHQDIEQAIRLANKQSILLYRQEEYMTFNMTYVLQKVSSEYKTFSSTRYAYEQDLSSLDYNIDKYRRLIESLSMLPDELDAQEQAYRDSCLSYATELLMMHQALRDRIMTDSTNYRIAQRRMEQNNTYAQSRYQDLQNYFFREAQLPFLTIIRNFGAYKQKLRSDLRRQYDAAEFAHDDDSKTTYNDLSSSGMRVILIFLFAVMIVVLAAFWGIAYLILWLIYRFGKVHRLHKKQLPLLSIFIGSILFVLLFSSTLNDYEYIQMGVDNINTFLWLLIAFAASMLLRVKPNMIGKSVLLYLPLFAIAFVIILARNTFIPDSLLVLIFPPLMLLISVRQLIGCLRLNGKVSYVDSRLGWASLAIFVLSFVFALLGYTFVGLLIFVWWYFQLAVLMTIVCIFELLMRYKTRWHDKRVDAMRKRITYVSGDDREALLFGATWLYDMIREVAIPALAIVSLPLSVYLSLNIFDFNDLFTQYYIRPFISITGNDGVDMVCISAQSIVYLSVLFLWFRYINRALRALWQYVRYAMFMHKHNRTTIRPDEVNLSLGNSIISVVIWIIFITIVFEWWKIPTGSLGLIAGGLSAGVGLALKDVINNFIYGIQLLGGRLHVGDWIECDGVRGKVTSINYQCVQVETLQGTETSFLNASLFGKNFNNLTRNNSYEKIIISTRVAYGADIPTVRAVVQKAMEQMRTKDAYGREVVEPKYGINVTVDAMRDSHVEIGVKQYVLVPEQVPYYDRAKEVIYNALTKAGIAMPFPQCDVHIVNERGI